ncbi:MFS general substrate transporter [Mollisia scopiformis]|uniref:MFS general substrate transporter n=1 Tax=Mollisia scopiformis TaxID=149040 RepID=A0A132B9V3_MOLSC|nr:MFS general substrate transporter [Mollisia scopiformis]KUJ09023.1 MFS general substrate transporter [Mollisia scopiformis]
MAVSGTPHLPNYEREIDFLSEIDTTTDTEKQAPYSTAPVEDVKAESPTPDTEWQNRGVVPPPDGGAEAWLQVVGSWCIIVTFGVYQAYYERGTLFTQTPFNISWIGSIQSLIVFLLGAVVGAIYDKGYLKLLLAVGTFGVVFGHMMLSLCTEYWQVLLAQGFVIGIGGACLFVPALAVTQPYFSSRLGLALGVVGTGSSLGCIVYGVVFARLIDRIGFAWTTRTIGFIALATLVVPLAISKKRKQPLPPQTSPTSKKSDFSGVLDGRYMLCVLGVFLGYAGCQVTFFYIAYFGQAQGWFVGNVALYLVVIINAGAIIGRLMPNWLSDKVGPINVVLPGSLLMGVLLLCNLAVVNAGGIICIALFFGVLSGIFVSLPPLLFMALTEDKSKMGARMGIAYLFVGLSVLPGGPGAGGVLQHKGSSLHWHAAWTYAGVLQLAAFVVFCVLRVWQGGLAFTVKI